MGIPSPCNLILVIGILLVFAGLGLGHVLFPDYFLKHSGIRKGGEMLTEWNRLGQIFDAILFATVFYIFYDLFINGRLTK